MLIVGVDEVGRGCIAGPVVAVAVLLPPDFKDNRIKDSKVLSQKARESLAPYIIENAISYGIGVVCSTIIDKINILQATKQAMQIAISKITHHYDKIIVDSVKLNNIATPLDHPNKADANFIEVAAASIIAKVYRDNLMKYLDRVFPGYYWNKNAGYGTKAHIAAIKTLGYSPLHRRSYKITV